MLPTFPTILPTTPTIFWNKGHYHNRYGCWAPQNTLATIQKRNRKLQTHIHTNKITDTYKKTLPKTHRERGIHMTSKCLCGTQETTTHKCTPIHTYLCALVYTNIMCARVSLWSESCCSCQVLRNFVVCAKWKNYYCLIFNMKNVKCFILL